MTSVQNIASFRALMRQHGMQAYILPNTDPHASEYLAAHWAQGAWLSGFTGEACTLVITLDRALLWTDSRYYLQAGIELQGSGFELMRESDIDCPSIPTWLCANMPSGTVVGVNAEMWSVNAFADLSSALAAEQMTILCLDLVSPLWVEDRPAIPSDSLYEYNEEYAGEDVSTKLARIRAVMKQHKADAMIISALDEIVWLLNIRGSDVEFNPVVVSYVVLEQDRCTLFVNPAKVDAIAAGYLERQHITARPYGDVFSYIATLQGTVLFDGARVNRALFEAIPSHCTLCNTKSPILMDKSHKNAVELEGERRAMVQDSIALTRFFKWLEERMQACREGRSDCPTEWDLMEQLHHYRAMGRNFVMESFGTIAGFNANGAIVHYAATPDTAATIMPEGMLLLDSGAQYLDGTTDITRTIWIGHDIPEQAKRDYTYVLKGHIALANIRWPRGTRGNQLDALAKQYMWQAGITYGHGTGHGVGHFLGCHEGPQNIRTDMNPTVLEAGQICSDEPGIYRTNQWGVRIENLVAVTPIDQTAVTTTNDEWLCWETLSLCYYDTNLIDFSLITDAEIAWLNTYHARVFRETAPLLSPDEAAWLQHKCQPITR